MSTLAAETPKPRTKRRALLPARASVFLGTLTYIIAMHMTYVYLLSKQYAYQQFLYKPSSLTNMGIVWAMALVPSLTIPVKMERPSVLGCIFRGIRPRCRKRARPRPGPHQEDRTVPTPS